MRAVNASACALAFATACIPAARSGTVQPGPLTPGHSWIARLVAPVEARAAPGAGRTITRIGALARWNGGPVGLLVLGKRTGPDGGLWLRVRLPQRPNGASAWIPANRTRLARTRWRVVVSLSKRTVTLLRGGTVVHVDRAVVGAPGTPTPTGLFAISERIEQPDARASDGSWVLLLTAFSRTLLHFGGGPGQIAIHGRGGTSFRDPLGSARSHGCIRIDNHAADLLAQVAAEGTPVIIRR